MDKNAKNEARINALEQLLENTQADVVRAFEGNMSQGDYERLKATRRVWKSELEALRGEPEMPEWHNAPDVLLAAIESQEVAATNDILTAVVLDLEYRMILREMGVTL